MIEEAAVGLYRAQSGVLIEADLQSEAKRPTFKKARDALLEYLKKQGWEVKTWGPSGQLKVPHATAPYMHGPKLWFKTQAVYVSGAKDKFNAARSTWDDIRDMTPEQFVARVEKTWKH